MKKKLWCPEGCGKTVRHPQGLKILECSTCGRSWKNGMQVSREFDKKQRGIKTK